MKFLKLAMCFLGLCGVALGRSTNSGEISLCNSISLQIKAEFLDIGRDIPTSWGELQGIKMIQDGRIKVGVKGLDAYNNFAIVPGAPLIQPSSEIPREYVGMHLFLIRRDPEESKIYSYTGRAAILIGPETPDPKERRVMATFLREEVAGVMIAQINGFDPKIQPLAFEKKFISEINEREEVVQREIEQQVFSEIIVREKKRPKTEVENEKILTFGTLLKNHTILSIVAILALIASFLHWRKIKSKFG